MIAPQELKQNNLIRDIESGRIGAVLTIGEKKCSIKMPYSKLSQSYEEFDPIELTEEWLLKFGFEKVNYTFWAKGLAVHNHDIVSFYMLYEQNRTYIKYVHQLQNLYFALTGQELTIKEQK